RSSAPHDRDRAMTSYAGTRVKRIEDARLLTGKGSYVDDISLPGMLHAAFVRSPFPRAAIRAIDPSPALAVPGVRAVFTAAAHVVSETVSQQRYAPVPMEGRGLVVDHSSDSGELTIYAATQVPHEVRLFCSRLLGMPEERIRVVGGDTGGGFGQKVMVQRDEMCLMLAAPKVAAPLKWVEDRRENLLAAGSARHEHADVAMAFDADGIIQAVKIDHTQDCGAYPTPWPVMTAAAVGAIFPGPYRVPKASFSTKTIYTNTAGRAPYRGPWQVETLAREV